MKQHSQSTLKGSTMRSYTDTATTVHHEDGSWTETTEITYYPASKKQKATTLFALAALMVAPAVPILTVASAEKAVQLREKYRARRAKKNQTIEL